jgi:uncharacterized protein YPO0396
MKKCKSCGKNFEPSNTIQAVCGLKCALKLSAAKTKQKATEKKQLNLKLKESLKTLGEFKKDLQIEVNKIVRLLMKSVIALAAILTMVTFKQVTTEVLEAGITSDSTCITTLDNALNAITQSQVI